MKIETGNAGETNTNGTGWFIGFGSWTDGLRHVPPEQALRGLCVKWMFHPAGDPRGTGKPVSTGRTVSVMVTDGRFRVDLSPLPDFPPEQTVTYFLERHGDYIMWGAGIHHRWSVERDCTIMTVRWDE